MYVEIVSGGQPFTAGRVCLKKKLSFAPWVLSGQRFTMFGTASKLMDISHF